MNTYRVTYETSYYDGKREGYFLETKTYEINAKTVREAQLLSTDLISNECDEDFYITSIEKIFA